MRNARSPELAVPTSHAVIGMLDDAIWQRLIRLGEYIGLPAGATLVDAVGRTQYAYILTSGLASLLALTGEGQTVEMAMLGPGAVISSAALSTHDAVAVTVTMTFVGTVIRLASDAFEREIARDDRLRRFVYQGQDALFTRVEQAVVCRSFHTIAGRLSTWLLRAGDHLGSDRLSLTHASLARVLGTPRTTVTAIAVHLQDAHALCYRRGTIVLTDRARLARSACACYADAHASASRPRSSIDSVERPTLS